MYRNAAGPSMPATKIAYRASLIRIRGLVFAILPLLFGLSALGVAHATHLTCSRAAASCTVSSYGIYVRDRERVVPLTEVTALTVEIRTGAKGAPYAEAALATKTLGPVPLAGHALNSRFEIADAQDAASALAYFLEDARRPAVDVWLYGGRLGSILASLIGLGLVVLSVLVWREQIVQLFPIGVTVDHQARLLHVRGKQVPFDEIADVVVNHGRALFWASGKNEHVPGFRLMVMLKNGKGIPLTRDHRVGPPKIHEAAKGEILRALGRGAPG